jgi:formylglycine-generating enzyme required for sulfatase activity
MKRLALLVATSEYAECQDLKPLHGSLLDVAAMQRVLVANGEFDADDVVVLKNAPRQAIEYAIHDLFNAPDRSKDDLVLFYFSGHGVIDEGGKLFLGTPSTRKQKNKIVKPSTVAASYLHDAMGESKSQHQVLIFNCCFSGAFAQGMAVMDDGSVNLKEQLGGKGRAILTSSSSTQFSFQPEGEMSIYTRYLVEGIETGAADRDRDSRISVDELHEYAALKVSQESPNMTPAFYPVEQGGRIYIARVVQAQDDPKLVYRRELEGRLENGKWSVVARRLLEALRTKLGLSSEDAELIKADVLKPILAKARKLQEYEDLVKEMMEECHNSPSLQELTDLRDYQKDYLGFGDEDVADIDRRYGLNVVLTGQMVEEIEVVEPSNDLILDLPNGVKLELVDIPAGSFMMGSDDGKSDEKPLHRVTVNAFKMGKYPITQKQYEAVMGNNPSRFKGNENLPVEQVSWLDAVAFCKKLSDMTGQSVNLPSEAQWEYACRAGSTGKYYFGDDDQQLENYAWYVNNSGDKSLDALQIWNTDIENYVKQLTSNNLKTHPVGAKLPNAWGLYDMHGNVCEWCTDDWADNYEGAPTEASIWRKDIKNYDATEPSKPLRGGSWINNAGDCRSACRSSNYGRSRNVNNGFRVVCVVR